MAYLQWHRVCLTNTSVLPSGRYRWAFIPEASDDSGLEVRRQGIHQREFKPYVVRLAKLLRKRAKVLEFRRVLTMLLYSLCFIVYS